MITFRLPRSVFSLPAFLTYPSLILVFLYFLTSSADTLNILLVLFKVKLTNAIAPLLCLAAICFSPLVRIPTNFLGLVLAMLTTMVISCFNSVNLIASSAFIVFFLFNFVCYFLASYTLFRFYRADLIFRTYAVSFYCVGFYALCQLLFSIVGIALPGACQYIAGIARGQAFTYEPSYYALYMTPFAIYSTTKFLLQNRSSRRIKEIFWPNFFLLISTSTGCFFTYLFFLSFLLLFRYLKIIQLSDFSIKKLLFQFAVICLSIFTIFWFTFKKIIVAGFLKFFYLGGASHFSFYDRWSGLVKYWNIFLEHPLIGISFGSGPAYLAIKAEGNGVDLLDPKLLEVYGPMNVTTEVLASVGILGGLCFLYFFYLLLKSFQQALKASTQEERMILISLFLSICVLFMTLQFSQTIVRCYMWIHIGLFCGYAKTICDRAVRT